MSEEDLKNVMRRVYVQYTNRVGPRVGLTTQEMRVLSDANWFDVLQVPQRRCHVKQNSRFDHPTRHETPVALEVVRTHANHRLQNVPQQLGNLQLAGVTWKKSKGATVNADGFYHVCKDRVEPVKHVAAHLSKNDHCSQLIVYAPQLAKIRPFPVDDYKGVGTLHVVMQLPQLRDWLWPQPAQPAPDLVPRCGKMCQWPQPPDPELAEWLQSQPEAAQLWAGGHPTSGGLLSQTAQLIRQQPTLQDLVQSYSRALGDFSAMEAKILKRATEIELHRREMRDLAAQHQMSSSPAKQYRALLKCDKQVCANFVDLDWEIDEPLREFTRRVQVELNSPQFLKHWQPVAMPDVDDGELNNSLKKALHMVNVGREEPLKLRWPLPHDVLKTWVAAQMEYGPSDDFVSAQDFGLALSPEQRAMREFVWNNYDQLETIEARCAQYPVAVHECQRLRPALKALREFRHDKQALLDAVRKSSKMRLLLDDILRVK
jgi:hypothetical protein